MVFATLDPAEHDTGRVTQEFVQPAPALLPFLGGAGGWDGMFAVVSNGLPAVAVPSAVLPARGQVGARDGKVSRKGCPPVPSWNPYFFVCMCIFGTSTMYMCVDRTDAGLRDVDTYIALY